MERISNVVKSASVKPAGSCLVGQRDAQGGHAGSGPTARVVEQRDGQTVLEVTCTCGRRITVNCNYAK
jgi:hypothetical protein